MAEIITHYFLSVALVWLVLGERKNLFLKSYLHKILFLALGLSSIVMDIDSIISPISHRLFTHTIFLPLLFLGLGFAVKFLFSKKKTIYFSFIIITILMGTHIVLDMDGPPPMGLLYPLDKSNYLIQSTLDWDLDQSYVKSHNFTFRQFSENEWIGQKRGIINWNFNPAISLFSILIFVFSVLRDMFLRQSIKNYI